MPLNDLFTTCTALYPGGFPGASEFPRTRGSRWVFKNVASGRVTAVLKRNLTKGVLQKPFSFTHTISRMPSVSLFFFQYKIRRFKELFKKNCGHFLSWGCFRIHSTLTPISPSLRINGVFQTVMDNSTKILGNSVKKQVAHYAVVKDSIHRVNPGAKLIWMKCFLKIITGEDVTSIAV